MTRFLHTADWQIGKPFARIANARKRTLIQQERVNAIKRMKQIINDEEVAFVLVAGDLFDSTSADNATVSSACGAIGQLGVPVYVIPGNHDHGGPGSVWTQDFFIREQKTLAPNLTVLLDAEAPLETPHAILFPCPLLRRAESRDGMAWLRNPEIFQKFTSNKPRIILAHGSTQDFSGAQDEDELNTQASNFLVLERLPVEEVDYIALGDWHGTKQITPKAWYSGTPENDRFQKGESNQPGHVLLVDAQRGAIPEVKTIVTARLRWTELSFDFVDDVGVDPFKTRLEKTLGKRIDEDLLRLSLTGSLGIEAATQVEQLVESLDARLLRLKLENQTSLAPTRDEIAALTERERDPLVSHVASRLVEMTRTGGSEEAAVAAIALRELHAECRKAVKA